MRLALILALAATPAVAQPAAPAAQLYDRAPWWMREPVLPSLGQVETRLPTNRAEFSGAFESIDRTAAEATQQATSRVRALAEALITLGSDKVRVGINLSTRPLYAQYRDKDGNLQNNERADKVERFAVTANVSIEVRDTTLLERAYALLVAARPTSTSAVSFSLEPENATKAELFKLAVAEAKRRATDASSEAGVRLGTAKLIDPSGRACQTDVLLAGAPHQREPLGEGSTVSEVVVTGSMRARRAPPPPPPPAPATAADVEAAASALRLPLQPPLQTLSREVCVVYALGG